MRIHGRRQIAVHQKLQRKRENICCFRKARYISVFISQAQHYRINGITCATCTSQLCQPCNAKTIFSSISDDGDIVDFQFENGERDQLSDEPPCQPFFRTPKTINSKPKYNDRTKDAVVEPIELPPFTLTVKVYICTANYTHHC